MKNNKIVDSLENKKKEEQNNYWYWNIFLTKRNINLYLAVDNEEFQNLYKIINTDQKGFEKEKVIFNYFQNFIYSTNKKFLIFEDQRENIDYNFQSFLINSKRKYNNLSFIPIEKHNDFNAFGSNLIQFSIMIQEILENKIYSSYYFEDIFRNMNNEIDKFYNPDDDKFFYLDYKIFSEIFEFRELELIHNELERANKKSTLIDYSNKYKSISKKAYNAFNEKYLNVISKNNLQLYELRILELITLIAHSNIKVATPIFGNLLLKIIKLINPNYEEKNFFSIYLNQKSLETNQIIKKKIIRNVHNFENSIKNCTFFKSKIQWLHIGNLEQDFPLFQSVIKKYNNIKIIFIDFYKGNVNEIIYRNDISYISKKEKFSWNKNVLILNMNRTFGSNNEFLYIDKLSNSIILSAINRVLYKQNFNSKFAINHGNTHIENLLIINKFIERDDSLYLVELYNHSLKYSNNTYWKSFYSKYFSKYIVDYEGRKNWNDLLFKDYENITQRIINKDLIKLGTYDYFENSDILKSILRASNHIFSYGENFWINLFKNSKFTKTFLIDLIQNDRDFDNVIVSNLLLLFASFSYSAIEDVISSKKWILENLNYFYSNQDIFKIYNNKELFYILNYLSNIKVNLDEVSFISKEKPKNLEELKWIIFSKIIVNSFILIDSFDFVPFNRILNLLIKFYQEENIQRQLYILYSKYFIESAKPSYKTLNKLKEVGFLPKIINDYEFLIDEQKSSVNEFLDYIRAAKNIGNVKDAIKYLKNLNTYILKDPVLFFRLYEDVFINNFNKDLELWRYIFNNSFYKNSQYRRIIKKNIYLNFIVCFYSKNKNLSAKVKEIALKEFIIFNKNTPFVYSKDILSSIGINSINLILTNILNILKEKNIYDNKLSFILKYIIENFLNTRLVSKSANSIFQSIFSKEEKVSNNETFKQIKSVNKEIWNLIFNSKPKDNINNYINDMLKNSNSDDVVYLYFAQIISKSQMILLQKKIDQDKLKKLTSLYNKWKNSQQGIMTLSNDTKINNIINTYSIFNFINEVFTNIDYYNFDLKKVKLNKQILQKINMYNDLDTLGKINNILSNYRNLFSNYTFLNFDTPVTYEMALSYIKKNWKYLSFKNWNIVTIFDFKILQILMLYVLMRSYFKKTVYTNRESIISILNNHQLDSKTIYELFEIIEIKFNTDKFTDEDLNMFIDDKMDNFIIENIHRGNDNFVENEQIKKKKSKKNQKKETSNDNMENYEYVINYKKINLEDIAKNWNKITFEQKDKLSKKLSKKNSQKLLKILKQADFNILKDESLDNELVKGNILSNDDNERIQKRDLSANQKNDKKNQAKQKKASSKKKSIDKKDNKIESVEKKKLKKAKTKKENYKKKKLESANAQDDYVSNWNNLSRDERKKLLPTLSKKQRKELIKLNKGKK